MLLYQYFEHVHAISAIWTRDLKISTLDNLNDPFEMTPRMVMEGVDLPLSECKKWIVDRFNVKYGMICLSPKLSDPVLWAHYAAKHTGMALGFDVSADDPDLIDVDYDDERVRLSVDADRCEQRVCFEKLIRTKFSSWGYEDEYRYLVQKAQCVERNGLFFYYPFFRDRFRKVVLGFRCPITANDMRCTLDRAGYQDVGISQVRPNKVTFEMTPRDI